MSRKKISQREARVMRKAIRLAEFELNALRLLIQWMKEGRTSFGDLCRVTMQLPIEIGDRTAGLLAGSAQAIDLVSGQHIPITVLVHPMGKAEARVLAVKLPRRMSEIMDEARGKGGAA